MGKPCAIGSVGFPCIETRRRRPRSFLSLDASQNEKPNRHLEHTIIPTLSQLNSLEDFLDRSRPPLSFLQRGFHRAITVAYWPYEKAWFPIPCTSLKAGYTVHSIFTHRISGFTPVSRSMLRRSTKLGLHGNWYGICMPLQAAQSP